MTNKIADEIGVLFEQIRKRADHDQFHEGGVQKFKSQLTKSIEQDQAIHFILPAFPAKSPNTRKKVLGILPDGAEETSLRYLHNFNENVQRIYQPGSKITIFIDSFIYSDLLGIPDARVIQYRECLERMYKNIADQTRSTITFVGPEEVLGISDFQESRESVIQTYGKTIDEVLARIKEDEGERRAYLGITYFLHEDLDIYERMSRTQREKQAKRVAKQMMQRKGALDSVIKEHYSDAIRLSIHPHPGHLGKIGINLISGKKDAGTPWHNVLVVHEGGDHEFMRKEKADDSGYEVVQKFGRPYYYR